jgi:hypothetical protein
MVLGYDSLFYLAPNYIWGFLTNRRFVKKIFWVVYTKLRISLRNKQKQNPAVWPVAHYSFVVRCLLYIRITPLAGNWCTNFMPGANISLIFIEDVIILPRITFGAILLITIVNSNQKNCQVILSFIFVASRKA